MAPGCGPSSVRLTTASSAKTAGHHVDTTIAGSVGRETRVGMAIGHFGYSRITSMRLVVAPPGTPANAPGPAENPANQLASSPRAGGFIVDGQSLSLTWRPEKPGNYPVIAIVNYDEAIDCSAPPPANPAPSERYDSEVTLATITVR